MGKNYRFETCQLFYTYSYSLMSCHKIEIIFELSIFPSEI